MKYLVAMVAVAGIALWTAPLPALTRAQRECLLTHFDMNDKLVKFGKTPQELLDDPRYEELFARYGNTLLVIRAASDLLAAKEMEDVTRVLQTIEKNGLDRVAPSFATVRGTAQWVKTTLGPAHEFPLDEALEQPSLEAYFNHRNTHDPEAAFDNLSGYGSLRQAALKRFRQAYGDQILKSGPLPRLENRLREFANAWFEAQYHKKLLKETKDRAAASLPALDRHLLELAKHHAAASVPAPDTRRDEPQTLSSKPAIALQREPAGPLMKDGFENALAKPWGTGHYSQGRPVWWTSGKCRATAQADGTFAQSGVMSLHIVNTSPRGPHNFGTTQQAVAIVPNQRYQITLWVRAENVASAGAVSIVVDPDWKVRPIQLPKGAYGWTKFTGDFSLPEGPAQLRILTEDVAEVWLDDIEVRPLIESPAP